MDAVRMMDLVVARVGEHDLAFSTAHVAGLAACPASLSWPPGPNGVLGAVPHVEAGRDIPVVDVLTYWRECRAASAPTEDAGRPGRPAHLLVLAHGVLAIPVDRFVITSRAVQPAPEALRARGVHALAPSGNGGLTIVLDMSRLVAAMRRRQPYDALAF